MEGYCLLILKEIKGVVGVKRWFWTLNIFKINKSNKKNLYTHKKNVQLRK